MWWKEAVVYQVYPRSFYDSNADGIGDLNGITTKLNYLKDLGIDVIWLSPHFKSPNADNGYDISDYEAIMDEFGTMADFDELLQAIHQKGMKLIIDLVVNHSSDEHRWFQESRKSKDNQYRDFYIWKKEIPNDWISFFSGTAWELDEITNEYYLHYFVKKQPDLNWENPKMRQAIYDMMHFWLKKGVNGFRMDVISLISKDPTFPNFPIDRQGDLSFYANGPKVHEYLKEMNQEVLSKYDCMSVGEAFGVNAEQANLYVGSERNELQMIYHFDHAVPRDEACFISPKPEFTLVELKQIFNKWDKATQNDGWNTVYFGNHDNPRMLSRFGDTGVFRNESAKMLATVLLTLRGTPYIYQGDEIGMSNANFEDIAEYNDVQVVNAFDELVKNKGHKSADFYSAANRIARDHARTPMQWSDDANAGFSKAERPWLKLNENYPQINVNQQVTDRESILNFYKKLIQIRKDNKCLVYGNYTDLRPNCENIWLYTRETVDKKILVVNNFTNQTKTIPMKLLLENKHLILANYTDIDESYSESVSLRPFEARIYSLK
jgi:oligo-1,6-glucosidase